jgi:lipoprotein-releasing system ATP-binding protein
VADPILSVDQVTREFGERVRTRAVAGVSFTLQRAELVALIGPSGSGKSSLLNIIGLLDRPSSGRVILDGIDTSRLDSNALTALRAHKLGFVFQFHHLLPAFSALENVMLPAWADEGYPTRKAREAAQQLLAAVGLADRMHQKSADLSGGQQQRVAIARALVRQPALVLADEPTGNLDTEPANEVFALMQRFNRELGTTFLVVTHDTRIADRCQRVIELVDGRVQRM